MLLSASNEKPPGLQFCALQVEGEALATLVVNKLRGGVKVVAVKSARLR